MNENYTQPNPYVDMAKHVLLLFFTFGIYLFIWIYKTSIYLNEVDRENYRDPITSLLLCIFVPFYSVYWYYTSAKRIEKLMSADGNVPADFSTIILILGIFVGIAVPILLQSKLNALSPQHVNAYNYSSRAASINSNGTVNSEKKAIEDIKAYKELLDLGAISQEEFDAKKKEILAKGEK